MLADWVAEEAVEDSGRAVEGAVAAMAVTVGMWEAEPRVVAGGGKAAPADRCHKTRHMPQRRCRRSCNPSSIQLPTSSDTTTHSGSTVRPGHCSSRTLPGRQCGPGLRRCVLCSSSPSNCRCTEDHLCARSHLRCRNTHTWPCKRTAGQSPGMQCIRDHSQRTRRNRPPTSLTRKVSRRTWGR